MSGNTGQRDFWTDEAGPLWVEQRKTMDTLFAPVLAETLRRAELSVGHSVLDIGCGAGTSTFAISKAVGERGHVTGVDISRTLLEYARSRGLNDVNVAFLNGDAQSHPLVPESADRVVSRFGVMFFDDSVAAFRNLANAMHKKGKISFSAWGAIAENPFFTLPAQVSRKVLGAIPRSDPDAPGPFALRDPEHVAKVLDAAGLIAQIEAVQTQLVWTDAPRALAQAMCEIGPAHSAIKHHGAGAKAREPLLEELTRALSTYDTQDGLSIPAQINYVTARKAS